MRNKKTSFQISGPALKTGLIYLVIGVVWILFSDQMLNAFTNNPKTITQIQTFKGWFFVGASAVLIFSLVSLYFNQLESAHKKLQKSKDFHLDLLNRLRHPAFKTNAAGVCDFINRAWMEYFNSTLSQETGNKWFRYINPADKESFQTTYKNAILQMEPFDMQLRMDVPGKGLRWLYVQAFPYNDPEGYYAGMIGLAHDITESMLTEEKIRFQSEFFKRVIDNIPFPIFIKDKEGVFIAFNREFERYLGLTSDKILGKTVFDFFSPEQAMVFYEKDQELMHSKDIQEYETHIVYPDGKELDVLFHKTVFFNPDHSLAGIIGIYFDISKRKKSEQELHAHLLLLEQKNTELEGFISTMAHDLKSPTITIKGFLGLLKDDIEEMNTQAIESDMQRISGAVEKMGNLIDDIIHISKVGKKMKPFEKIDIIVLVEEVIKMIQASSKTRIPQIVFSPDIPVVFYDKAGLRDVFFHLVDNSVKFSRAGTPISIEIGHRLENKEHVFFVKDNGMGIDSKNHEKIFKLFEKCSSDTLGNGIGLPLVRRIIELHGGRIWVESKGLNQGTCFFFTLPAYPLMEQKF